MSKNNSTPRGKVTNVPPKAVPHNHQTTISKLPPPPPKTVRMSNYDSHQRELPQVSKLPPPPPPKK